MEDFVVGRPLRTLIYVPDFVSGDEEEQLLRHIYEVPSSKWKCLKNRRLQNWGGVVHEMGLLPQELPPWMSRITRRISEVTELFPSPINHVLVNEYLPNQGIMPHQDGPAYFPVVAILSLGCAAVVDFTPHSRLAQCSSLTLEDRVSLLLMPRSLLIFKDEAYSDYLHGIEDSDVHSFAKVTNREEALKLQADDEKNDIFRRESTRVSLTCRLVPKVRRNLFKF
ncbi:oxidoreductase [Wolffia australiana]